MPKDLLPGEKEKVKQGETLMFILCTPRSKSKKELEEIDDEMTESLKILLVMFVKKGGDKLMDLSIKLECQLGWRFCGS